MPGGYPASVLLGSVLCAAYRNPNAPTMAPIFPAADEMPWHVERSLAGKISAGTMKVVELGPKLAKKKVLRVVGHVQHEPAHRRAQQVVAVAPAELPGEEAVLLAVAAPRLLLRHRCLLLLVDELDVEHARHVGGGLLVVPGDKRRVARRLGHLHPPVVGEQRRDGAEHEHDAPRVVGFRHGGAGRVVPVRRRVEPRLERGGHDEGDDAAGEVAEPLHGEHRGGEPAAGAPLWGTPQ
uniref:Uncharacterized protein n=1 Tax=Oryza brachyantha TaxID=4533 RepID=J3LVT6_ORYBR